jgi:hypothetical protein
MPSSPHTFSRRRDRPHTPRTARTLEAAVDPLGTADCGLPATETRYLDLDGDGVPDAVETIETFAVREAGNGKVSVLYESRTVAADIGIDGVPHRVMSMSSR